MTSNSNSDASNSWFLSTVVAVSAVAAASGIP
jgi:hypothetical protein